jgi:hypothetical protein
MKVIRHDWDGLNRTSEFRLYPLGDSHIGNKAADEKSLRAFVGRVADDAAGYWIGMGDYIDAIQRRDKRFSEESLPRWLHGQADLNRLQRDRFLSIIEPIAGKCLGLIEGNHERYVKDHFERDIYLEIVNGVKELGGFSEQHDLAFGVSGWLILTFRRVGRGGAATIRISLHHGFVGGKLAGAKALNMQRWLWNHDCDLAIFNHSHNLMAQVEAVERVRGSRVYLEHRRGMYGGSFLGLARYAEAKGYFPVPVFQPHAVLRPGAHEPSDRVRMIT